MLENENVEFKEMYTEKIYKEIVAFLNTNGGNIYVGYDDEGNLIGLNDSKEIEEKISNGISQKITPDASIFVSVISKNIADKNIIIINVSKGINIYSLTDKGILKGTYVRNGSCSIPASEESVRQMIIKNYNLSFETMISNNQDLTFDYAKSIFEKSNINIFDDNIMKNINLKNNDNKYTHLGLLFSDQNPYSTKIAVYEDESKTYFLDRKEFRGSILKIYEDVINYLLINSSTFGIIDGSTRKDIEEYPEFILREITLNAMIHKNYDTISSNIINIYKDSMMEFISYGSLYGDITIEDILDGLSQTRNPSLQSIFMRLKKVEAIGSGLRRINEFYKKQNKKVEIKSLPSSFIVRIPKIKPLDDDEVVNYIKKYGEITKKEVKKIISKDKRKVNDVINKLVNEKKITKVNSGLKSKYIL